MIDNFTKIKQLINFPSFSDDDFIFCQLIQRRKENPTIGSDNNVIKDYYFDKNKTSCDKKDEIIKLCDLFNARAYIHLNKRSYKDVSFECLSNLAIRLQKGDYKCNKGLWPTSCGRRHSDKNKKWVVDIDGITNQHHSTIIMINNFINEIAPVENKEKIYDILQTKNGLHLITSPFNVKEFSEKYSDIDIHKNNPTILYCT